MIDLRNSKYRDIYSNWKVPLQTSAFLRFHDIEMLSSNDVALLDKNYDHSSHTYDEWRKLTHSCFERQHPFSVDQYRYRKHLVKKIESSVKSFNRGDSYREVISKVIEFDDGLITTPMYRKRSHPCVSGIKMEITNPRNGWFALCDYWSLADNLHEYGYKRVNHSCWEVYDKSGRMRTLWGKGFDDMLHELTRYV